MSHNDEHFDRQFQEDLEKATALSMETLALDEFRRSKLRYSQGDYDQSKTSLSSAEYAAQLATIRARLNKSTTVDQVPPPIPRRSSVQSSSTATLNNRYDIQQPKQEDVPDLISFSASENESAPPPDPHRQFVNMVGEMYNYSNALKERPPTWPTQSMMNTAMPYGFSSTVIPPANNMQLVPYVPDPNADVNRKVPLTPENLSQLYSISNAVQPYGLGPRPFRPIPSVLVQVPQMYGNNIGYAQQPYVQSSINNYATSSAIPVQMQQQPNVPNYTTTPMFSQTHLNSGPSQTIPTLPPKPVTVNKPLLTPQPTNQNNLQSNNSSAGSDLINLNLGTDIDDSRVSVLEAFDPLRDRSSENDEQDYGSDCAASYYSEYDPFDYLYNTSTQYSDPVYEAVNKINISPIGATGGSQPPSIGWNVSVTNPVVNITSPPPLPPRNNHYYSTTDEVNNSRKLPPKLYQNVIVAKQYSGELMAFYNMVRRVRLQYKYDDLRTNIGHVMACEFDNLYQENISIKLLVHPALECLNREAVNRYSVRSSTSSSLDGSALGTDKGQIDGYGPPVVFTCDIGSTVDHVIMHVFCEMEGQILGTVTDFMLKPIGVMEWLSPTSKLSQLECVHNSLKMERDVHLGLCPKTPDIMQTVARSHQDDTRDANIKPEDIFAHEPVTTINYDNLMILLETLEAEIDKLESAATDHNPRMVLSCSGVKQAVKMICALLGSIDTIDIGFYVEGLNRICERSYDCSSPTGNKTDILSEDGDYAEVKLRPRTLCEQIQRHCNHIRDAVQQLVEMYSQAFRVDFCVNNPEYLTSPIPISQVTGTVMLQVFAVYRPQSIWRYDDYRLGAQIYHGTRYIGDTAVTRCSNVTAGGMFARLTFNSWLNFESIPICTLPREARLVFVLYGCTAEPAEGGDNNDSNSEQRITQVELGWSAIQFFDFDRNMISGSFLLSMWPPTSDKYLGPAPASGTHPQGDYCPVLNIEIPALGKQIVFPEPINNPQAALRLDFNDLDKNLQQELIDTAEQGYSNGLEKREVLWEKRHYLHGLPHALPKILHAAHSWDFASLVDLHALIRSWDRLSPLQALELLLPRYPDLEVRAMAVHWISAMPTDLLVEFLPQLLQALKHDTYDGSPLAALLLSKSLESPRVAHHLYWLLVHSLPGESPQNSLETVTSETDLLLINQARYHRRYQMLLRALLASCGEKLSARFLAETMMCRTLADIAQNVKVGKETSRQRTLIQGMELVNQMLMERQTSLPLGPGYEVTGVQIRNCSYFNSNTLPLKINFFGPDNTIMPAIFKCGDDLQQDMLTIQLVRIMDKLWLKEGLDLKMVTFNCVPTGHKKGMIEMVTEAETLRKIQVEWGLTGSFKDKPISEWLARQNPSQLEYQRAVANFTVSCAGYSVATYILGICDRHNDNIMLKTSGHLFHIDFGKFLGDAQMFGNFKRDRTPFVLTSDMAYVINGGDKPSTQFHHFVDLCCKAFNIVRKHGDLLLHMLALMATSGIPGVTADAVNYVRNALLPGQSNPEAAASFAKMIHISLKSWFVQFNFFLHNLAQLRFTGDEGNGELLSFVPRTYTMAMDGRLKSVQVHGFQKRYDVEKYYTYILKLTRQNQPDPAYLFRSYKEFCEFHQKLCLRFPLVKLHSLPTGMHVGRSNIKTVAERRLPEIRLFLLSLFNAADEIAHSDLVYTFFHPILRDQQEANIHVMKVKEVRPTVTHDGAQGEVKVSFQYHRGCFTVMIHHARNLPVTTTGQEPNTYVKVYLKPDNQKITKRKTKVVRKSCCPSFMETLEYRMPLEHIKTKALQVTVWSHDALQENEFLGGQLITLNGLDLRKEHANWYKLIYLPKDK